MAQQKYSRITTKSLQEMKSNGDKISMITSYDYTFAGLVDSAGYRYNIGW
jgi:3-methyl-2-oxobutanoate hydroxymethyltransferase